MRVIISVLMLFLAVAGCVRVLPEQFEWDKTVSYGTLPNDIRYAIRKDPGGVIISALISVGSLHETTPGTIWALRSAWENDGERTEMLAAAGITWQIQTHYDHSRIEMQSPSGQEDQLQVALQVLEEWLFRLRFENPLFLQEPQVPAALGSPEFFAHSFTPLVLSPSQHAVHSPYGTTIDETLRARDVKTFYEEYFRGNNIYLAISSPLDTKESKVLLQQAFTRSLPPNTTNLTARLPFYSQSRYQIISPAATPQALIYLKFAQLQLGPSEEQVVEDLRPQLFLQLLDSYLHLPEVMENWADIQVQLIPLDASLTVLALRLNPKGPIMVAIDDLQAVIETLIAEGFPDGLLEREKQAIAQSSAAVAPRPAQMALQLKKEYPVTTKTRTYQNTTAALRSISATDILTMAHTIIQEGRAILLFTNEEISAAQRSELGVEIPLLTAD